mmetsp:Transcript_12108/g.44175  ORF Transcript_12108/g.44175 Transcript_12108/m.44175 type:complete len:210 (-) Transcript_12108:274-903(-)
MAHCNLCLQAQVALSNCSNSGVRPSVSEMLLSYRSSRYCPTVAGARLSLRSYCNVPSAAFSISLAYAPNSLRILATSLSLHASPVLFSHVLLRFLFPLSSGGLGGALSSCSLAAMSYKGFFFVPCSHCAPSSTRSPSDALPWLSPVCCDTLVVWIRPPSLLSASSSVTWYCTGPVEERSARARAAPRPAIPAPTMSTLTCCCSHVRCPS